MSTPTFAVMRAIHCVIILALCWVTPAQADVSVLDDAKRAVTLKQPAKRIISLAPHVTELVFAAGAGERLVAVSS